MERARIKRFLSPDVRAHVEVPTWIFFTGSPVALMYSRVLPDMHLAGFEQWAADYLHSVVSRPLNT